MYYFFQKSLLGQPFKERKKNSKNTRFDISHWGGKKELFKSKLIRTVVKGSRSPLNNATPWSPAAFHAQLGRLRSLRPHSSLDHQGLYLRSTYFQKLKSLLQVHFHILSWKYFLIGMNSLQPEPTHHCRLWIVFLTSLHLVLCGSKTHVPARPGRGAEAKRCGANRK